MARKLKVYAWQDYCSNEERETLDLRSWITQVRAIVAAPSKAAAARAGGFDRPSQAFNLGETGNSEEIAQAMSEPGVVFIGCMDGPVPLANSKTSTDGWLRRDPERGE